MQIDQRELRDVFGCFATGVTIISGRDTSGKPQGLTVNSFSSVSLDPPLVLFSLDRAANSAEAFDKGQAFTVNILGRGQEAQSNHFASKAEDKFATSAFAWADGTNGIPCLQDALAHLECTCETLHDGGDHWIIIGRVTALRSLGTDGAPLVFFRGRYADLQDN